MSSIQPSKIKSYIKMLNGDEFTVELMPEPGCNHIELEERYCHHSFRAYECKECQKVFIDKELKNKHKLDKFIVSNCLAI